MEIVRFKPTDSFFSVTHRAEAPAKATEAELLLIYDSAFKGLKGDSLAIASGFLPVDFNRLCEFDDKAAEAVLRGRADCEARVAGALVSNALNGDTKAATKILESKFGWVSAKPEADSSHVIEVVVKNALPDPKIES